ncbi:MAG: hypothetical protein SF097_27105 [Acidobacteriota bacterium]|nr:hypothetical protein [Acidobacteriota bacterium]
MSKEPSVIIEDLKEKMFDAGYIAFTVTEENGNTVLEVQQTLTEDGEPRFWSVLSDLGINFSGGESKATISAPPFGVKLPVGQYSAP